MLKLLQSKSVMEKHISMERIDGNYQYLGDKIAHRAAKQNSVINASIPKDRSTTDVNYRKGYKKYVQLQREWPRSPNERLDEMEKTYRHILNQMYNNLNNDNFLTNKFVLYLIKNVYDELDENFACAKTRYQHLRQSWNSLPLKQQVTKIRDQHNKLIDHLKKGNYSGAEIDSLVVSLLKEEMRKVSVLQNNTRKRYSHVSTASSSYWQSNGNNVFYSQNTIPPSTNENNNISVISTLKQSK